MSTNGVLGYDNRVDEATVTGAAAVAGAPVTSLLTRDLWDPFEVAGGHAWFELAWPELVPIRLCGIYGLEVTKRSVFQLQGWYDDAKTDRVLNTGDWPGASTDGRLDIVPQTIPFSQRQFEQATWWDGKPSTREWNRWPKRKTVDIGAYVRCRRIRWDVWDEGNIRIGRPFAGAALQPVWNFSRGAAVGAIPFATTRRSASGHRSVEESRAARTFRMSWEFLTDDERRAFYDLVATTGETGEVAWMPYPAGPAGDELRWGGLYTLRSLPPVVTANADQHRVDVELEEWK